MAAQGTATKAASIDTVFASSQNELYANRPFHGALFRLQNGQEVYLQYIDKQERLTLSKWLNQKDISQGQFQLETRDEGGNEVTIPFMVDKNGDSTPANPFFQHMPAAGRQPSGMNAALQDEMEAQIVKLRGKVSDLTDELVKAKRELGDDKTETVLTHEKEKRELEKTKDSEIRALENEISDLKTELKFKELEFRQGNGDKSVGNRLLDILQANLSDDFLSSVAANIGQMMQAQGGTQPTAQQLQDAYRQAAESEMSGENEAASPGPRGNPDQPESHPSHPQPETKSQSHQQPTQKEQMAQVKQHLSQQLIHAALEVLTDKNANLEAYATEVQSQLALLRQQGITLDAEQWVQMAKVLGERAAEREITPDRVAKVIEPALAGLPQQTRMMLSIISPQAAAEKLFSMFNIEASPAVKGIVVKVLDVLKNSK